MALPLSVKPAERFARSSLPKPTHVLVFVTLFVFFVSAFLGRVLWSATPHVWVQGEAKKDNILRGGISQNSPLCQLSLDTKNVTPPNKGR